MAVGNGNNNNDNNIIEAHIEYKGKDRGDELSSIVIALLMILYL